MMTRTILKRRNQCSTVLFVAFVVGCAALITLPGFLFYYFWMGAGIGVSTLIGFLLGSFTLSLIEVIGTAIAAICRLVRKPAKSEMQYFKSRQGAKDV